MNNKVKIIAPVLILAIALGIGGYSKAHSDIDPMEIINRINGNVRMETPNTQEKPQTIPKYAPNTVPVANPSPIKTTTASTAQPSNIQGTVSSTAINKNYMQVSPLEIVKNPAFYINKRIKFQAKFDKFSTLGLDYQPAMRRSEDYITVLIQRPDIHTHDIPLSELKIFMDRNAAEKHIDLNSGDEVEIAGVVFSKALGDAWMNVDNFTVIKTVPRTDNN